MINLGSNWKLLIAFYICASGLWGFFLKIASRQLDWKTALFCVWISMSLVYLILIFKNTNFAWSKFHLLALLAGIIASIGTMAFYKALSLAPASLVIPFSAQYILITVLLCIFFLKEPLNLRIILGILTSIIAIALLAK